MRKRDMATKLSQKKPWCKFIDDDLHEVKGHQRCGKRCTLVTKLGQKESLMQVYDSLFAIFFPGFGIANAFRRGTKTSL